MMKSFAGGLIAASALFLMGSTAFAEPEIVSGPAAEPECFAPWADQTTRNSLSTGV